MDHRITVCTSLWPKGSACQPGYELIDRLRKAMVLAGTNPRDIRDFGCRLRQAVIVPARSPITGPTRLRIFSR